MRRFLLCFFLLISTVIYANDKSNHRKEKPFSSATDYFRSVTNGDWGNISTWESSSTPGGPWSAATLVPNFQADTIIIQSGDTVTISTPQDVDEVVIQNGGLLDFSLGTLTVEDGAGDDINILSGGVFVLSLASTPPNFVSASATCNVAMGGTLRVSAGGLTFAAPAAGVNAINFVYNHLSILEYTLAAAFATDNVTYFPNVNSATIPIFRTTASVGAVGAITNTAFNGIFEANGAVAFVNTGTKTFRNGIRGTGNINGSTSGKFIINGATAELGGSGSLTVPTTGGLEIGTPTTVTMTANKTITGNVSLLSANSLVVLGPYNLTVSGNVSSTNITSYVKTNGAGVLTLQGVDAGGKLFQVGNSTINPVYISSPSATSDFSARIVEPVFPSIFNPAAAVTRAWYLKSSIIAAGVILTFGYNITTDVGGSFVPAGPVEVAVNISTVWNIHQTGIIPDGTFAPIYSVGPINPFGFTANTEFPFSIGNHGAILPIDCIISTGAQKINNTGIISWTVNSCSEVRNFEVQRSVNGSGFQTIGTVNPAANQTDFNFTDAALAGGRNLYRIKVNGFVSSSKYSNTVVLIHNSNDILISSLVPNPVHDKALLTVSAGRNTTIDFKIYNATGNLVKQWSSDVREGNNTIEVNAVGLAAGMYTVFAYSKGSTTVSRFVKQ